MYTSHTKSLLCYQQERIPEDGFTRGFVINEPSIPCAVFTSKHRKHGETIPVKLGHTTCNLCLCGCLGGKKEGEKNWYIFVIGLV